MLLVDHAALWLKYKNCNWQTIAYPVIKQDMEQYFIPTDNSYHAHTQLAQCKHTGNVNGYITAFTCLALKVPDLRQRSWISSFVALNLLFLSNLYYKTHTAFGLQQNWLLAPVEPCSLYPTVSLVWQATKNQYLRHFCFQRAKYRLNRVKKCIWQF